jgi:phosphoribosylanthranilate isomerase
MVADAGADAIGLNFYPQSPRYVDPRKASELLRALPPMVDAVGVFVSYPLRQVCALAYQLALRSVQMFPDVNDRGDPFPFRQIAAFRVRDASGLEAIRGYLEACRQTGWQPAAVLVDALVEGQFGGTGARAPWELLRDFRPGVPLILAGGITPENAAEAIATVRPWAIDVASGVESAPGIKDPIKVRRLIEEVRAASQSLR